MYKIDACTPFASHDFVLPPSGAESATGSARSLLDKIHDISSQTDSNLRLLIEKSLYNVQKNHSFDYGKFNANRKLRYQLLDVSKKILIDSPKFERFHKCLKVPVSEYVRVIHSETTKTAHWNGLSVCGSVWVCPVCGSKIMSERCQELLSGMEKFLREDRKQHEVLMLVLTHSHTRHDSLESLMDRKAKALTFFFGHRSTREALKSIGHIGHVNSMEITTSKLNGWHPHNHVLLFNTKKSDQAELKKILFPIWERACSLQGLSVNEDCFTIQGGNYSSSYVSKLHQEMTLSNLKTASTASGSKIPHYTPMQLLYTVQEYKELGRHSGWFERAYREYAEAMKGRKQLVYSRGLKDRLGLLERSDEELAQPTETDFKEIIYFASKEFKKLCTPADRSYVLQLTERGDYIALFKYLYDEKGIHCIFGKDTISDVMKSKQVFAPALSG